MAFDQGPRKIRRF